MKGRLEHNIEAEEKIKKMLMDMPQFMTDYYCTFKQGRQPKACLEYLRKIKKYLEFVNTDIKNITINDIDSPLLISKYMDEVSITTKDGDAKETSLSYQQQIHSILNSLYSYLEDNGDISKNPMKKIKRVRGRDCVNRIFLTEDDLKNILDSVNCGAGTLHQKHSQRTWRNRDKTIMMLFMETGIRVTALCEINVDDIDFNNNTIQVINKGYKPYIYKFEYEFRHVLLRWLRDRHILLDGEKCDALFISNQRKRITSRTVSELVAKYSMDALGYKISPHKLRAAFANMILRNSNGNIYLAQRLLDHESPTTTKIYLKDITDEDKEKATLMVSDLLF